MQILSINSSAFRELMQSFINAIPNNDLNSLSALCYIWISVKTRQRIECRNEYNDFYTEKIAIEKNHSMKHRNI